MTKPEQSSVSMLKSPEIKPQSLNEIFAKDPTEISDDELDQMVSFFRSQRANFQAEDQAAKLKSKRTPLKAGISLKDLGMDLGDLGFDKAVKIDVKRED